MSFTGGAKTGCWPFQLTTPASIAFCSDLLEAESCFFKAVMGEMGLRWEVTSTNSPA